MADTQRMGQQVAIRVARDDELEAVLTVERAAFCGPHEADLVSGLLDDSSAQPLLSLLALVKDRPVGHALFTRASLPSAGRLVSCMILAPLAVIPGMQHQGIGARLIAEGLKRLRRMGVKLVFVLGYPDYYIRHGFKPAGRLGLAAPYLIEPKNADAWMVHSLVDGILGSVRGTLSCADFLYRPEYWKE